MEPELPSTYISTPFNKVLFFKTLHTLNIPIKKSPLKIAYFKQTLLSWKKEKGVAFEMERFSRILDVYDSNVDFVIILQGLRVAGVSCNSE